MVPGVLVDRQGMPENMAPGSRKGRGGFLSFLIVTSCRCRSIPNGPDVSVTLRSLDPLLRALRRFFQTIRSAGSSSGCRSAIKPPADPAARPGYRSGSKGDEFRDPGPEFRAPGFLSDRG